LIFVRHSLLKGRRQRHFPASVDSIRTFLPCEEKKEELLLLLQSPELFGSFAGGALKALPPCKSPQNAHSPVSFTPSSANTCRHTEARKKSEQGKKVKASPPPPSFVKEAFPLANREGGEGKGGGVVFVVVVLEVRGTC